METASVVRGRQGRTGWDRWLDRVSPGVGIRSAEDGRTAVANRTDKQPQLPNDRGGGGSIPSPSGPSGATSQPGRVPDGPRTFCCAFSGPNPISVPVHCAGVAAHRFGSLVRLVGEAIRLEFEFGTHTLEALLWIAQTVNASVYVPGSLVRTSTGFRFALANPPLRIGGFSEVHLLVNGTTVPPDRVRVRLGPSHPWRTSSHLSSEEPLELQAGSSTEFDAEWPLVGHRAPITVRLEFQSVAIPPIVWLEIHETPGEVPAP